MAAGRAPERPGCQPERTVEQPGAFAHIVQSLGRATAETSRQTTAIVGNAQEKPVLALLQTYVNRGGSGVFDGIVDGLLHDPVKTSFNRLPKPFAGERRAQVNCRAELFIQLLNELA